MMPRLTLAVLVGLLGAPLAASAQPEVVHLAPPVAIALAPGEAGEASVRVTVDQGFHVQANPAANEFLIPLTLAVEAGDAIEVGDARYPPAERFRLQGADEDLLVYGDTFAVSLSVRASAEAREGVTTLAAKLRYQACDDRLCLRPATLDFELPVRIVAAGPSP